MSNNYRKYHESVAKEFEATRDRVRYFIDNAHHGEDGRYKEILLMNYLRRILPSNVSVGTGFVKNGEKITKQIDLIIYDNTIPTLFSEGDFVIAIAESIRGIIEVKSNLRSGGMCKSAIENADYNGSIIDKEIFNGIFSYELGFRISNIEHDAASLRKALKESDRFVNHISIGPNNFIRYWNEGNPMDNDGVSSYSFYQINNLSFGYFISNLIETIYKQRMTGDTESNLTDFFYPIREGKESRRLINLEVRMDVPIS